MHAEAMADSQSHRPRQAPLVIPQRPPSTVPMCGETRVDQEVDRGTTRRCPNRKRMKVLLVEDEFRLAATVRRGLQAEGFVVVIAGEGTEGLQQATEGSFDAV